MTVFNPKKGSFIVKIMVDMTFSLYGTFVNSQMCHIIRKALYEIKNLAASWRQMDSKPRRHANGSISQDGNTEEGSMRLKVVAPSATWKTLGG